MKVYQNLLSLFFPEKCPFCRKITNHSGPCAACQKNLPWAAEDTGLRKGPGGLVCAAPLLYQDTVREALLRLKFHGGENLARPLGELVAQCAAERFSGEFDVVTWAPVSAERLRERGYDQAQLLAQSACRVWDTAPERLLEKIRNAPPQSGIQDVEARRFNVLDAYRLAPGARVFDRRILLIDDICTTGATLTECVRVLTEAGAERVVCAAVALTAYKRNSQGEDGKPCASAKKR